MYDIRLARETDKVALVRFIDQHWKKNHIFVTCNELLKWQHYDEVRRSYNFVIGVHRETQVIHAILGFIPLSQFDDEIDRQHLCWMAIWKVQDAARGSGLGRRLLSYLEETIKPVIFSTVAASEMTLPMYRARGYETGRLNHHYILNPEKSEFQLVVNANTSNPRAATDRTNTKKRIEPASESAILNKMADCFLAQQHLPHKTPSYIINRYLRHPFYLYQAYAIKEELITTGIILTRVCSHNGSRAIRIVDFIGPSDSLGGLNNEWLSLLSSVDAEYIDFYSAGISEKNLLSSGFIRRESGDSVIIPNLFEPFSQINVDIDYMINTLPNQSYRIVKGDSDQDRPSIVGRTRP